MKQALILKHVPFEGPATIRQWLEQRDLHITQLHTPEIGAWQDLALPDWLVIMGGPMSVNDTAEHPWLVEEMALIKRAIDAGKKVLGICLGAQLIARTLGAEVTRNAEKEIGWFPIKATSGMGEHPIGKFFANFPMVLHWHGDTFAIPDGAEHLAQSVACTNQVFTHGNNVLALQCHLEMARPHVERLCDACADELREGGRFVQPVEKILAPHVPFASSKALLDELLDAFAAL